MKWILLLSAHLFLYQFALGQINCTAYGNSALASETSGGSHVATGAFSLYYTNGAWDNSGFGSFSLYKNTTGNANSAFGFYSSFANLTGYWNTSLGVESLSNNKNGFRNIALGIHSLRYYDSDLAGNNTAVGSRALHSTTTGGNNTAIGMSAGYSNTIGNNNTYLGGSNFNVNNLNNATAIGEESYVYNSDMVLVGGATTNYIGGAVNWTTLSDKRAKRNIVSNYFGLDFINQLNPVTYAYDQEKMKFYFGAKSDEDSIRTSKTEMEDNKIYTGFIAQEVVAAAKNIGFNFSGIANPANEDRLFMLQYESFVMPLINSVKEIEEKNKKLTQSIKALKERLKKLKEQSK